MPSLRLEKTTLETYIPGTPGSPGSPGQPYLPPRQVVENITVCSFVPYTQAELQAIYRSYGISYVNAGPPTYEWVPVFPSGISSISVPTGRTVCNTVSRVVNVPAQPYVAPTPAVPSTPAQTLFDFQLGWNARARSIEPIERSGSFTFRIPSSVVGVIVGLSPAPRDINFADIRWGFRVTQGQLSAVENGVDVQSFGAADSADELTIERLRASRQIVYRINGTAVRTVSNDPSPMYLTAALYSGGDAVYDAELSEFEDGYGEEYLEPIQAFGGTEAYGIGAETMLPMTAEGSALNDGTGYAELLPMQAYGSDAGGYAIAIESMSPMTAEGEGIEELSYAIAAELMQPLQAVGSGLTGTVGGAAEEMLPIAVSAAATADLYGQAIETMSPMVDYGENYGLDTEATMFSIIYGVDGQQPNPEVFVVMTSGMQLVSLVTTQTLVSADALSVVTATTPTTIQQQIEAVLESFMRATPSLGDPGAIEQRSVWALSLDAMGSTRYEQYDFNSFAEVNGRYFGMRADGLYLLQGPNDSGEKIAARVNLGRPNMGELSRKGLPYVYIGAASDGTLVLKVIADGRAYYYRASGQGSEVKTHRFTPGLGLRATNYELEIQNSDGGAFDLASIEFVPVNLSRRI